MSLSTYQILDRPALAGGLPIREADGYLTFGAPDIREEDIREVVATLRSGWIGTGPRVKRLQEDFAAYLDMPYAVAMSSCTSALRLAMLAGGLGPGDEVITTPMTFCATINAILHSGAKPVLADCNRRTHNLDPREVLGKITSRTRALLPVHFAGRLCDMETLRDIARRNGLMIIEDCAHAIETLGPDGGHAGTYGDIGAFSFYATKNLTTAEGGMVVTRSRDMAERLRRLSMQGMNADAWKRFSADGYRHYDVVELGYKCNMSDLQAALGIHQLERIERNLARREAIWARYDDAFRDLPLVPPAPVQQGTRHARHLYTVEVGRNTSGIDRDLMLRALHAEGIGAGVHYVPVVEYPFYRELLDVSPWEYPNAVAIGERTLSLPLSSSMTDEDVEDVVEAVWRVLAWEW